MDNPKAEDDSSWSTISDSEEYAEDGRTALDDMLLRILRIGHIGGYIGPSTAPRGKDDFCTLYEPLGLGHEKTLRLQGLKKTVDKVWTDFFDVLKFTYTALKDGEVRILRLLPPTDLGIIQCQLSNASLEQLTETGLLEVALSYCWGPSTQPKESILVNGWPMFVGEQLHDALRAMQSSRVQTFWIDAICINQESITEKNSQVPLMASIYSNAQAVVAWLGPAKDDSDFLIEAIEQDQDSIFNEPRFKIALARFILGRPWFERTWVIQEFVLAKFVKFVCGSKQFEWGRFWNAMEGAFKIHDKSKGPDLGEVIESYRAASKTVVERLSNYAPELAMAMIQKSLAMEEECIEHTTQSLNASILLGAASRSPGRGNGQLRETFRPEAHGPREPFSRLRPLLVMTADFQATDARDKIYGVLGMMARPFGKYLNPDYTKPVKEVHRDAMIHMLALENDPFAFLYFSLRKSSCATHESSPSWVPDFSEQKNMSLLRMASFASRYISATAALVGSLRHTIEVSDERDKIFTDGISIGRIVTVIEADIPFPASKIEPVKVYQNLSANAQKGASLQKLTKFVEKTNEAYGTVYEHIGVDEGIIEVVRAIDKAWRASTDGQRSNAEPLWRMLLLESIIAENYANFSEWSGKFDVLLGNSPPPAEFSARTENSLQRIVAYTEPLCGHLQMVLCEGRCFFVTEAGYCGISEPGTKEGDFAAMLFPDVNIPMVMRKVDDGFKLVGIAHLTSYCRDTCKAERTLQKFTLC